MICVVYEAKDTNNEGAPRAPLLRGLCDEAAAADARYGGIDPLLLRRLHEMARELVAIGRLRGAMTGSAASD